MVPLLVDLDALKLLEQPRRYLGWTQEQWALVAGQALGDYRPTPEDALILRKDWLRSMQTLDQDKKDTEFAARLFYNVGKRNFDNRGFDPMDDRAKCCG